MPTETVRVRVAPSPTGDPHVGTAYQGLFNNAFARKHGGAFVLRIEDTDRSRSTGDSERAILDSLRWLGLRWDEGPDVGGPHAPYRQSERTDIYREHVDRLLGDGNAYPCFCTRERLETVRKQGSGYDRRCRDLDPAEARQRAEGGEAHVVRMKVPTEGVSTVTDLLRGEIRRDWSLIDDQVILKSDGFPTYHLANVVDDHLMEISHVIRGEEWINSLPKHMKLYEYFGWEPPVFCHLPLLRNNDKAKTKLSKRKNPTGIRYFREAGYLPQAMLNFLGLMGWTQPDGEEKFTFEEMAAALDLKRISLGSPVFDLDKLRWLNGRYIREDLSDDDLYHALRDWKLGEDALRSLVPLVHSRLETLADWGRLTPAFFMDDPGVDPGELVIKGRSPEESADVLQMALWRLEEQRDYRAPALEALFKDMAERFEMKLRDLTVVFYQALSGSRVWTPLFQSMEILGPDMVRMRLRRAVAALGGGSSKRLKKLEKEYRARFAAPDSEGASSS